LLDQARVGVVPPRPAARPERERVLQNPPRVQALPPTSQPAMPSRFWGGPQREAPAIRDTRRAPEQQQRIERAQGEADRIIRQQQLEQEVLRRQQAQQDLARRQQEFRVQQDALRRQQEQRTQLDAQRREQERRTQLDALRRQQELQFQQEQAARLQQERAAHEGWQRQLQQQQRGDPVMQPPQGLEAMRQQHERAAREALQRERQMAAPPRPQEPRREAEGRGGEPRWQRDADEAPQPGFGRGGRWQRNG
jgi:hypothetical protein